MGSAVFGPYFPIFLFFFFLLSIFSLLLFFFLLLPHSFHLFTLLFFIEHFVPFFSSLIQFLPFPPIGNDYAVGMFSFQRKMGNGWDGWRSIDSQSGQRGSRGLVKSVGTWQATTKEVGGGSFVRPLNLDLFCFPVLVCSGCVLVKEVVHGDGTRVASWRGSEWPFYTEPLPWEGSHCLAVLGHDRIGEVDQASQQRVIRPGDPVGLWGVGVGRDAKGQLVFAKPDVPKLWRIFLIVSNGIWEKLANVSFDLVRRIYAGDLASPLPCLFSFPDCGWAFSRHSAVALDSTWAGPGDGAGPSRDKSAEFPQPWACFESSRICK